MKLSVCVDGVWICVNCVGTETIRWLVEVVIARNFVHVDNMLSNIEDLVTVNTLPESRSLHLTDQIDSQLKDGDRVSVTLKMNGNQSGYDGNGVSSPLYENGREVGSYSHPSSEILTPKKVVYLDGSSMTCDLLMSLGTGEYMIKLTEESIANVKKARDFLETDILQANKVTYGINTGFGRFATTIVAKEDLQELQNNLILHTAAGVGNPLNPERTRRVLALRINVLAKGYSGISLQVLEQYIDAFNASCLSWVPEKGTVGASGDLAPLAHLALGLMGIGKMWSPKTGWDEASKVLKMNGLRPVILGAKEGLALINGTQFITALGVEALVKADAICKQADVVTALTLEALKGTTRAYDPDIHKLRPHPGQIKVAGRLRSLLHSDVYPSKISESHWDCKRVQDAYTLRCCPQVHGITNDTIDFVRRILETEMNSATDNPIILADRKEIISGGNFHGEYPAKALDFLAIGIHEIGSICERRIERLINPAYSGLPAFLTNNGGLNSGFMVAHCTAAALVSENKCLCHPSSVDSQTTSAGTEDHVSMGGYSARKAITVVENVEYVVAIELLAACQGIEFHRPLTSTAPLEEVHKLVRSVVRPWDKDRFMAPDIDAVVTLLRENKIWKSVQPFMDVVAGKSC